ncbi:urease accessory protein UreF [Lutibaculum baratangense]|uniref:Urease accessory protein UreF n=1 Tax=Lutibaculum baratangense AMV1 TaxID=631454 RepID=V4RNT8_9HYPH|nr:urease accessory protein UreF [Lutibaculum baratangense]ESR24865.1 Urease accessory protein UreF [Lutibaculum baratangense AMV1]
MSADRLGPSGLYRLMSWLSPAFPIGAFSHSHGLEWAVHDGTVRDAATCRAWIAGILNHGAGWQEGVLLAAAWRTARAGEREELEEIDALALALAPSHERRIETTSQGAAFERTACDAWGTGPGEAVGERAYAVAVAAAAARHGVPLEATLLAYLHAVASNLVSAAIRLVPLGQTDGQLVVAALEAEISALAERAARSTLDDLGGFGFRADIASMKHEEQHVRLFRT